MTVPGLGRGRAGGPFTVLRRRVPEHLLAVVVGARPQRQVGRGDVVLGDALGLQRVDQRRLLALASVSASWAVGRSTCTPSVDGRRVGPTRDRAGGVDA